MKKCIRLGAKAKQRICRFAALLLVAVMLAGILPQGVTTAEAAQTKQRVIGIVFDNSGSMYMNGRKAWCQAIYAMEVFASMANDGDTIVIYPMNPIKVDNDDYSSEKPLIINVGTDNPAVIRDIYTEKAGLTPITTIDDAYKSLTELDGEEKWLIVLTDGNTFNKSSTDDNGMSESETEAALSEKLSKYNEDMNVLYLGISHDDSDVTAADPDISNSAGYVHEVEIVDSSEEILETLTDMCNTIYGRDIIEDVSDQTVTFDVSMSKLILFVQGDNISGLKLYDASGSEISMSTDPFTPSYSTKFCGNTKGSYQKVGIDETLSGTIATYADLDAGTYTFTYSGDVTSVAVYYEPDVTLTAYLTDEDGNSVDSKEAITAGTYYLNYALVDKYGEETTSELLGDREYTITYTIGDSTETVTDDDNGRVELDLPEDTEISASVTAKYLDNYVLSVTSDDGSIPMPTHVEADPAYALTVSVSGGESTYSVLGLEDEAVYTVTVAYNGETLTGEELASVDLTAALDDTGSTAPVVECELSSDGASYTVSLKYPSGGAGTVEAKDYTLEVNAAYVEEKGREVVADTVKKSFTVEAYEYGLAASIDASSYYSIYEMNSEEGQTVTVKVTRNGEALTAEEMAGTELEFSADGLEYTVEKDTENSRFVVTLKGEDADGAEVETGDYTFTATVSTVDELGNTVSATAEKSTSVGLVPKWMMVLFGIIIFLLIALLIFLFMNMKVLPKNIAVDDGGSSCVVDGLPITDGMSIRASGYSGGKFGGRKKGSVKFKSPEDAGNNTAYSMSITMKALDPRFKKSRRRRAKVLSVSFSLPGTPGSLDIGDKSYSNVNGVLCLDGDPEKPIRNIKDHNVTIKHSSECHASPSPTAKNAVDYQVTMEFRDR